MALRKITSLRRLLQYAQSDIYRKSRIVHATQCSKVPMFISSDSSISKPVITPTVTNIEKKFQEKMFEPADATIDSNEDTTKSMKYTFIFLGVAVTVFGTYIIFQFGAPERNENGEEIEDEFSSLPTWKQYIFRGWKQLEHFTLLIQEPSRDKLLPDTLQYPYYQPPYTLVLEFTDVMAHPEWTYKTGWRFKKRPGLDYMLENLVGLYEIVVFTAEPGMTIFPVIEAVDQKNLISYKLVRDSTHFVNGHHIKNLSRLNRDLKKVVVVDWNSNAVKFQPENHLNVKQWKGEDDDKTLIDLTSFLKTIAETEIEDVREVLKFYKQYDDPLTIFRKKQIEYLEKEQNTKPENKQPIIRPIKSVFDMIL